MKFREYIISEALSPNQKIALDLLTKAGYNAKKVSSQVTVVGMGKDVDEVRDTIETVLSVFDFKENPDYSTPGKKSVLEDEKTGLSVNIELHRGKLTVGIRD